MIREEREEDGKSPSTIAQGEAVVKRNQSAATSIYVYPMWDPHFLPAALTAVLSRWKREAIRFTVRNRYASPALQVDECYKNRYSRKIRKNNGICMHHRSEGEGYITDCKIFVDMFEGLNYSPANPR
jgi:hypothetical protein